MSTIKIEMSAEQSKANLSSEVLDENSNLELQERVIDNPAKGNCGYYAFAIGLINIIQQEGTRTTFDKWVELDSSIYGYYDAICKFDFDKPNNDLLEALQRILRLITYNLQLEELRWACTSAQKKDEYKALVATSTYRKFAEMYHGTNIDPRFNQFVSSPAIKSALAKIDHSTIVPEHDALVLAPLFMSLVYGKNVTPDTITVVTEPKFDSPIIRALQDVTRDSVWATHLELDYLANAFEVNLHTLENGVRRYKSQDLPSRHTITVDNQGNYHWTTRVTMVKKNSKALAQPNSPLDNSVLTLSSKKITGLDTELQVPKQLGKEKDAIAKKLPTQNQEPRHEVTFQKKNQPVITNREKEKTHDKKSSKSKHFLNKQTLFGQSEEVPLTLMHSKADQKELNRLIRVVNRAVIDYCAYSDGIIFSFFHRHGESGRTRARDFNKRFSAAKDSTQAKEILVEYLNNSKNGNTNPHSFRTILLQELLANELHHKRDLKYISKNYSELLAEFKGLTTLDELSIF